MPTENTQLKLWVTFGAQNLVYEVPGGALLIGSDSHCDVRLLSEDAAPEQLRIELRQGVIHVHSLAPAHPCTLDGRPFEGGVWPSDSVLAIGQVQLRAELVQAAGRRRGGRSAGSSALPLRLGMLGAIGFFLYVGLSQQQAPNLFEQTVEPPELFPDSARGCSAAGEEAADFRAARLLREAQLKAERSPFYARDGVLAVAGFEEAAACFERVARAREAKAAKRSAELLRGALQNDFHVRQVRLERLLNRQKYESAAHEVRELQTYLANQSGAYAQWLAAVQRELNARFAAVQKNDG